MPPSLTVLIEAHNEEKNIKDCIVSAKLVTNDIVVVDMDSTDKTASYAKEEGCRVEQFIPHPLYVEPARGFGINCVKTDWVMILDPDERMTPELAREILSSVLSSEFSHYKIPRKNSFGTKKWLQHGGWWPDHQIRLIQVKSFRAWPQNIHSTPQIDGKMGLLKEPFLHYFHGDIKKMVEKTVLFEDIESNLLYEAKKPVSIFTFFRKFMGELYRRLIQKRGYKDGIIGIIESVYQAYSKTITYLFLYEKTKSRPL